MSGSERSRRAAVAFSALVLAASIAAASPAGDIAAIEKWEHDAVAADLAGNADFYVANLADDWTGGMSNGAFQTKAALVADLRDTENNITLEKSIADLEVRLYGDVAVATFTETYDALVHGERRAKTIISTETFVRRDGKWLQISAHSSAVPAAQ